MNAPIAGRLPVLECLRAKRRTARRLFLLSGGKGLEPIRSAAKGIPIEECARDQLNRLSQGVQHQGVVLEADPLPVFTLDDWLRGAQPDNGLVVILDGVEDPHNFGAIARSAAACGAHAVVFGKDRSAPLSPAALKSAAGAMEHIDLVQATNIARGMKALKAAGYWIAGLDADGDRLLWHADFAGPTVLVVGSEGKGMRHIVRKACDYVVRIPISGPITSLNASVSAGIVLAECLRQRAGDA
jgi:23S rRNA (guanosine2251-2'-O)-methyltransferase